MVTYSDVQGGYTGAGNIDANPSFVDAVGGNLRLGACSPCVDAGNNNAVPGGVSTDLDGNPRFVDDTGFRDTGEGPSPIVDMGAYERQINSVGPIRNVTGGFYYLQIQAAIDGAGAGEEIEVAPGIYQEAINFNGKAITLRSTDPNDPSIMAATVIDGTGHYHVVQCISSEGPNTILAGFTITGGNAIWPNWYGGGMYNSGASPTVKNCTFSGNRAELYGGGMYNSGSSPTVKNCDFTNNSAPGGGGMSNISWCNPTVTNSTFSGNSADYKGGGMYNENSSPTVTDCNFTGNTTTSEYFGGGGMYNTASSPTVTNCSFSGNTAALNGGGMHNYNNSSPAVTNCTFTANTASGGGGMSNGAGSPTVTSCSFSGNSATGYGGGMGNSGSALVTNCNFTGNSAGAYGGGMCNWNNSTPTVTNCTFTGNTSNSGGGGMYNYQNRATVTNCFFRGNSADDSGAGIYNRYHSTAEVTNCILWGDIPDEIYDDATSWAAVTYSDVHGGWPGEGNIDISPLFVDAGAGDFRLNWYSPCVDAGDNSAPGLPATDLDGNPRVIDGDGDGNSVVDMGVYELEPGLFKVGLGTLAVTVEPNEVIDAGAKWKVRGGDQWYDSGDVVTLTPGYYEVEVNELPDWFEPETLLVGYDTVDSNYYVPQQTLWVRVIGDVNAVAIAEYKPLPLFDIGQIPPRDAPHGRTLEFRMDANWLGDDVSFSFTTTFDPNYPEPEGPILIDPVSGLFTYEPNDANDRTAFTVTFRAESGADANEQAVRITPIPDLPLEYEIFSEPIPGVYGIPDPCDYIFVNEILSDSQKELNGELRDVRSVTIAGELIFIEDVPGNPVYVYNDDLDVNDLTICTDTLIIRDRLSLPQTDVTIYACKVIFEDRPGSITDINTTPVDLRAIPEGVKTDGLRAGNISLYIESYEAAGGLNGCFIMNGTKGYYGGSPGDDGVLTCTLDNPQPFAWLSPYSLKMVIARARDTYLYRYTAETHDILSEYDALLNTYRALPEWEQLDERWQYEFGQMHQEIITLLHRIDNGLDYFGNPLNWVPALSFEVLYSVYEQEIGRAIRVMYLSYWLQNKADDISKKDRALKNCRDQLWDDTVQAKTDYNGCRDLIGPLKARADSIANRIGRADGGGCYGLLCDLKQKEESLLERAKRDVHEANKVPWWKTAGRALATIGTSMFKGASAGTTKGPKGAAAGALAGGVIGSISVLTDDSIMNPNPWPQASMRTDVAKQFSSIDFDQATEGWIENFNDIEKGDIEANGADVYLQTLEEAAAGMSDGLWDVKEALKTTSLDNEEVEAKLKEIKATDPTFNRLVDDVTELMVQKQLFNCQLAAAMQEVATLSNSMTNNVLAIDAMNRNESHLNRIVDPKALMYLKDMERRALARLRKYHYYMAKAYEYRLLEPYPGDLNIDAMFSKIKDIAATPLDPCTVDGRLGPDDFDALKAVYEEQLSTLTQDILTFYLNHAKEQRTPGEYVLSQEQMSQLNAEVVTVNLLEEGDFPSGRENIRIIDMNVAVDINVVVTGNCGTNPKVVLTMHHPSVSKLQWKDNIYLFRHLAEDTKAPLGEQWTVDYYPLTGGLYQSRPSPAGETLLCTLLSEAQCPHGMIYSRPGLWADIVITKENYPDSPACRMDIEKLRLLVEYDYFFKQGDLQTLRVATEPNIPPGLSTYELLPYFLVDTADESGREDGIGDFYRIYDWWLTPDVYVTAPKIYGNWRFEKWIDEADYTLGYDLTLPVSFTPDPYLRDDQTVYAQYVYEGPILNIADFNLDYDVDFKDYAALSRAWFTQPANPEWDPLYDVSDPPDDFIDWRDLAVLCDNWLESL